MITRVLLVCLVIIGWVAEANGDAGAVRGGGARDDIESLQALRYRDVLGQQDWYTCGAAAVATWLTFFLGRPVTEGDVLEVASEAMAGANREVGDGLTLLSLKEALASFGVDAVGYRVSTQSLFSYFESGGLPLLMHVTRPELHYVLAVAMIDDQILLADPSYGRRSLSLRELEDDKGFKGVVLAAVVDEVTGNVARDKQRAFVDSYALRFERLRHVREWMRR